jgi:lambda family phage portal protein
VSQTDANALDRLVTWLAPGWGARRLAARASMQAYYDGATVGRRGASIRRRLADANTITGLQLAKLRDGSRDLVRNNPYAKRGIETIVAETVGVGIRPHFTRDGKKAEDIEELAVRHLETTECDSDGRLTYGGIQGMGLQGTAEGGDMLIRRRWCRPGDGFAVPVQFQLLEPEFLDERKNGPVPGGQIIQGVEFDAIGRRRAYWLFREHPGGVNPSGTSYPVPAVDIAPVYRLDRSGQVRGIPWLSPVMLRLADFGDYEDAQLMRQKIAACFAGFVTETYGTQLPGTARREADRIIDSIEPGIMEHLLPGQTIEFADPPGVEGYAEYSSVSLHAIAAGLGISYESLTGDLRGVSFSSGKLGRLAMERNVARWRAQIVVPQVCDVLMGWWLEAVELTGVDTRNVRVGHQAPKREMIDPREVGMEKDSIRSGQKTLFQSIRETGRDPVEHLEEWAEGAKLLDALGLVLDSDPRTDTSRDRTAPATKDDDEEAQAAVEALLASRINGARR